MTDPSGGPGALPPPPAWPPPAWPPPAWPPVRPPGLPGTVQAAVMVTYVCCCLTVVMTLLFLVLAAFIGSMILPYFEGADRVDIVLAVLASAAVSIVASAVAGWLAWQTGRRRSWARTALIVCSGLALVASVLTLGPHTVIIGPGSLAVIVLLFLPDSTAWFRPAS